MALIRWASIAATALVALGFLLFAIDEAGRGSREQVDKLAGAQRVAPSPRGEQVRERRNGDVREAIDDANDLLLKPFAGIVDSNSAWVERGVPALLGILVYGFVVQLLAGYILPRRPRRADSGPFAR